MRLSKAASHGHPVRLTATRMHSALRTSGNGCENLRWSETLLTVIFTVGCNLSESRLVRMTRAHRRQGCQQARHLPSGVTAKKRLGFTECRLSAADAALSI
jgi:hypothetical protein